MEKAIFSALPKIQLSSESDENFLCVVIRVKIRLIFFLIFFNQGKGSFETELYPILN